MNAEKIIDELSQKYPGKKIIKNDKENPTEILCEIDPSAEHPESSIVENRVDPIFAIDKVPISMKNSSSPLKYIRTDIPGIFNEAFILKKHLDRFNYILNTDIVLPPYEVLIHPCRQCNLRCEWCIGRNISTRKRKTKESLQMLPLTLTSPSNMEKLINNLLNYKKEIVVIDDGKKTKKTYKIENVTFSGIVGEPLMAKKSFIKAIRLLTKQNIRVGVYSNSTLLDDQLIEELLKIAYINISIDAGSPSTYSKLKYSGGKKGEELFNRLIRNINKLVEARNKSRTSNLQINASYVLSPGNYKEIYKTARLLKKIGIDNFRMKQDNLGKRLLSKKQMDKANELLNKIDRLTNDKFKFIKIHKLNSPLEMRRTVDTCMITDLMTAIGSDGNVHPCNYHPEVGGFSYGNAIEEDFQQIWEGEKRKKIKQRLPSICPKVCDPFRGRANKLFEEIKKYQVKHGKEKTQDLIREIITYV